MIDPPFVTVQKYTNFSICVRLLTILFDFDLFLFDFINFLFVFWIELFDEKKQEKTKYAPE